MLLSSSVRPVSMPFFRFWYSAFCNSFLRTLFRLTVAVSAPCPFPFGFGPFPLAFALGSGYSAFENSLFSERFFRFIHLTRQKRTRLYYHTVFNLSTHFSKFFEKFFIFLQMRYFIYFCFASSTMETICTAGTTNRIISSICYK